MRRSQVITYFTDREKERGEMHLLLILLIPPAFGRPSISDIDSDSQFNSIVEFTKETGKLLNDSSVIDNVVKMLQAAEKNMIVMTAELRTLKTEDIRTFSESIDSGVDLSTLNELKTMDNVFPKFNMAKSYVRETREELRKLAYRTVIDVSDVKPLIEALDETNGALFIKISINRIKELMNVTLVTLEEAKIKYNLAIQDFENIKFIFAIKNRELQQFAQKIEESARNVSSTLKPLILSSGFPENSELYKYLFDNEESGLNVSPTTIPFPTSLLISSTVFPISLNSLEAYIKMLNINAFLPTLQRISDEMLESINNFEEAIKRASDILVKDINLAGEWNQNAKLVSANIDLYPEKYLRTVVSLRNIFLGGLETLKHSAEIFLAHPKDIDQVD